MKIRRMRIILVCAIAVIVLMACGAKDASTREKEPESNGGGFREIKIVRTITPEPMRSEEYTDFDLENLSIVRKENEENRNDDGVGEDINADTAGSIEVQSDDRADDLDNGARPESDAASSVGSEEVSDGDEQDSYGDSEGTAEPEAGELSELPESEPSDDSELEGQLGEYSGYSEDGYSDGCADESEVEAGVGDSGLTDDEGWVYYANCRITHYDTGACCCGVYATGYTASGTLATVGRTVATGEDLPFGTEIMINGQVYIVEDRGVEPYCVDILVPDHETALAMGMYYTDVYIRYPTEE